MLSIWAQPVKSLDIEHEIIRQPVPEKINQQVVQRHSGYWLTDDKDNIKIIKMNKGIT